MDLRRLPEHEEDWDGKLSEEFADIVEFMPSYGGLILDKNRVMISFFESYHYDPIFSLKVYLNGALFAMSSNKICKTNVPRNLEGQIKRDIKEIFNMPAGFTLTTFSGKIKDYGRVMNEEYIRRFNL